MSGENVHITEMKWVGNESVHFSIDRSMLLALSCKIMSHISACMLCGLLMNSESDVT